VTVMAAWYACGSAGSGPNRLKREPARKPDAKKNTVALIGLSGVRIWLSLFVVLWLPVWVVQGLNPHKVLIGLRGFVLPESWLQTGFLRPQMMLFF